MVCKTNHTKTREVRIGMQNQAYQNPKIQNWYEKTIIPKPENPKLVCKTNHTKTKKAKIGMKKQAYQIPEGRKWYEKKGGGTLFFLV